MSWKNKKGVDDNILGKLMSAFTKDESNVKGLKGLLQRLVPGGETGKVKMSGAGGVPMDPSLSESEKIKMVLNSALLKGGEFGAMLGGVGNRYYGGPEYIRGEHFEEIGDIINRIDKEGKRIDEYSVSRQGPVSYDYTSGKNPRYEGVTDQLKLVAMVTDALSMVDKGDPSYAPTKQIFADKYGSPELTGKSFGQTDVQDILKLLSEGGISEYPEDNVALETILDKIVNMKTMRERREEGRGK